MLANENYTWNKTQALIGALYISKHNQRFSPFSFLTHPFDPFDPFEGKYIYIIATTFTLDN